MQEELRRSNTIGDLQGIVYFASTILKSKEIKRDSARQICSFVNNKRINFNSAVAFFEYLELISESNNILTPTEAGKKLYAMFNNNKFTERLCEICIHKIIADSVINIDALRFDTVNGKFFILKYGFPIATAVFRNVLIQLRALTERPDGFFELSERYENIFAKVQKATKQKMSLEILKNQLEQQEKQGEAAELYVLGYEIKRLTGSIFSGKIKRISDVDVSAGYDIVSFEDEASLNYDRYIEVKSFVGQPHFYWSKNEIEVATVHEDSYYLYLVNIEKIEESDYKPTIIRNPAKEVLASDDWLMQPISYLVLPVEN